MAQPVVEQYVAADEAGRRRNSVAHRIDHELRPAFAPEISCDFGGVSEPEHAAHLPGAVGRDAVHLADPEYGMGLAVLAAGAANMSRFAQLDGNGACDRAERLAPADHARDRFLVHAVLQRHDETARRKILGIIIVAQPVSYDFVHTKAMSIGLSFASACSSVTCRARAGVVNSGTSRRWLMRRPLVRIASTFSGQKS